jgi:hypothetical protein
MDNKQKPFMYIRVDLLRLTHSKDPCINTLFKIVVILINNVFNSFTIYCAAACTYQQPLFAYPKQNQALLS